MNKVKLGKILRIKHGYAFKSENYIAEGNIALVTLGNISGSNDFQFDRQKTTFYGASFPEEFLLKAGDLIMPLTEQTEGLFGNSAFVPEIQGLKFALNQRVGKVIPDEARVDKYFLHYLLATDSVRDQLEYRASGTQQRNISPDDVYDVTVYLPDIEKQRKIGKLLYVIENKINTNKRINDNLQHQMCLIYEQVMSKFTPSTLSELTIPAKNLAEISTGSEDANHSTQNGKYKFFTCANNALYCDDYAYDAKAILVAGNGDFNVKHYTGKFNAYQRTYVLIPNPKYYAILYLASLYRINSFKSKSSGSIVKFITKDDIENIPVYIPDDNLTLDTLNKLINIQEKKLIENEKLIQFRDWLLPMLMNGQATISD